MKTVEFQIERVEIKAHPRKLKDTNYKIVSNQDCQHWILVDDEFVRIYDSPMIGALTTPITLP